MDTHLSMKNEKGKKKNEKKGLIVTVNKIILIVIVASKKRTVCIICFINCIIQTEVKAS